MDETKRVRCYPLSIMVALPEEVAKDIIDTVDKVKDMGVVVADEKETVIFMIRDLIASDILKTHNSKDPVLVYETKDAGSPHWSEVRTSYDQG